jgi:hypothetical protein
LLLPAEPQVRQRRFLLADVGDVDVAFEIFFNRGEVALFEGGHGAEEADAAGGANVLGERVGELGQLGKAALPMLSPYVLFNSIIGVIATMQIFGEAYIMTAGGPADSTMFYAYYLFKQAFQYFRMGYASALAWILFLIVLALTVVQLWLSKRWVHYEQA